MQKGAQIASQIEPGIGYMWAKGRIGEERGAKGVQAAIDCSTNLILSMTDA